MHRDRAALDALDFPREHEASLRAITADQARAIDRWAARELGMPTLLLMENAGRAVAAVAKDLARGGEVFVLAGSGNNGGDGLAAARFLAPRAKVALSGRPDPDRNAEAALQLRILESAGVPVFADPASIPGEPAVLVDALLGTGLTRSVEGKLAEWIRWIAARGVPVVAVDLPSGIHSDTGAALGVAVKATVTVTFARAKAGCTTPSGRDRCGRVVVASLGLPEPALQRFLAAPPPHSTMP